MTTAAVDEITRIFPLHSRESKVRDMRACEVSHPVHATQLLSNGARWFRKLEENEDHKDRDTAYWKVEVWRAISGESYTFGSQYVLSRYSQNNHRH